MAPQLQLFGTPTRCFFSLDKQKSRAVEFLSSRFNLPVVTDPKDLSAYATVFFSLHSFRDFYKVAAMTKRPGQEWIAGGGACVNPTAILHMFDYIYVGKGVEAFHRLMNGERAFPGLLDCSSPAPVTYQPGIMVSDPITPNEIILSEGCRRRCLFCVNAWIEPYREQDPQVIQSFIRNQPKKGCKLSSNASDDVSYFDDVERWLQEAGKTNMVVSNSVYGLTDAFLQSRSREILIGVEGMSERLRKRVNKPLSHEKLVDTLSRAFSYGCQVRTVFQFNLPTETLADFDELMAVVDEVRAAVGRCSWALPFIPHQPTAHTPMQWEAPFYSLEMLDRIIEFRKACIAEETDQKLYVPYPLYPTKWLMQIVAQWLPVTDGLAAAFKQIHKRAPVDDAVQKLNSLGFDVAHIFQNKDKDHPFPWDLVTVHQSKDSLWSAAQLARKAVRFPAPRRHRP